MLKHLADCLGRAGPPFDVGAEDIYEVVQPRVHLAWKKGGPRAEE